MMSRRKLKTKQKPRIATETDLERLSSDPEFLKLLKQTSQELGIDDIDADEKGPCKEPQFEQTGRYCPTCLQRLPEQMTWLDLARVYDEIASSGSVCSLDPNLAEGARKRAVFCYERFLNSLWISEEMCEYDPKTESDPD